MSDVIFTTYHSMETHRNKVSVPSLAQVQILVQHTRSDYYKRVMNSRFQSRYMSSQYNLGFSHGSLFHIFLYIEYTVLFLSE